MITHSLIALAALTCVGAASAQPAAAAVHGFSFRAAEFMDDDKALAEAQAFLATQEPKGLPMADAARRLSKADMYCKPLRGAADGSQDCSFAMMAGGDGGTLGEDIWTVRLRSDSQGRLAAADLDHDRTGFRP